MDYFSYMPTLVYPDLDNIGSGQYVGMTNILTRSAFIREISENTALFYDYQVKDNETAEVIADKLYGDPRRRWIVLLFNQLMDPSYDFPLLTEEVHTLIQKRYGQTVEQSQLAIHHYEEIIVRTVFFNGMPSSTNTSTYIISAQYQNPNTGLVENRPFLPGVADTTVIGPSDSEDFSGGVIVTTEYSYSAVSNYTYEMLENEKRRAIRLLDAAYVGSVESELRRLMRNDN